MIFKIEVLDSLKAGKRLKRNNNRKSTSKDNRKQDNKQYCGEKYIWSSVL